ncbi:MAG: guanylate kinase [Firmicutes bacterium]|nr:guanylate kinase [Bacillota bacterium]
MINKSANGLMFVISGPSGVGKGTIYNIVLEKMPFIKRSISVTTRQPRVGEAEGINYYFKTIEEYQQMIANGDFLETASVFQNYYGTPKAPILTMLEHGDDVMFEIDVEGAKQIKTKYPACIQIFIMTPTLKILEDRLRGRGTESKESLKIRLNGARGEIEQFKQFDYLVFNDNLDEAVESVMSIIKAEKSRMMMHKNTIYKILND